MSPLEQVPILADALRRIGQIAVEPDADAMGGLLEAQSIADRALQDAGIVPHKVLKFARLNAVQEPE